MVKKLMIHISSLPLSVKMMVTMLILSLVPLFVAGYFVQKTAYNLMLENKRSDLITHTGEVADTLSREIENHLSEAAAIAGNDVVRQYADNPTPGDGSGKMATTVDAFLSMHAEIKSIFFVDLDSGKVIFSTSDNLGYYLGNRSFIKQTAAGMKSTSAPSRDGGKDVIYYSAPVTNSENRVVMAAVSTVDAESFWEPLQEDSKFRGPGSVAIITDEFGVRIGHGSDRGMVYKAWAPLPRETVAALLEEQHYGADITEIEATDYPEIMAIILGARTTQTFTSQLDVRGETYEFGLSKIPGKHWTVMTAVPHSSFLGALDALRKGMMVIIIVTALIVTAVTLIASRFVSKPIRLLVSSAQQMADGDFTVRVPPIHDRELGCLSDEFNKMRTKVAETYNELEQGYLDMAKALVASLEARDHYTAGHTERVGQYAVTLARRLGLDDEETTKIKKAADLHDIGKVGVSDSVLLKPAKLSPEEFAEIKRHPGKSGEIVRYLGFLRDIVPAIEGHHERYDGKGYPRGLRGKNIPLGARILAVADAYDAMTTKRAYRDALSHEVAIRNLKEGAGSQWDPHIVDAFLEMIENERGECQKRI